MILQRLSCALSRGLAVSPVSRPVLVGSVRDVCAAIEINKDDYD
tara:strand:- start:979 stop:1110 length:132 start_codon:yes stop_codon:yes gene_type:complete